MPKTPPSKPDFESLDIAAVETADERTMFLALIGNLSFSWSNNESMFIYFLMLLLDTDEIAAAVVFSTLNTTRARLELVKRLAKIRITDKTVQKTLDKLIERFNVATAVRNEFNHATFEMNERGDITHTRSLRIIEQRGTMKFGQTKIIDQARLDSISDVIRDLRNINRDLWDFLPLLKDHLDDVRARQDSPAS